MAKQNKISAKQMNSEAKDIYSIVGHLAQVLKQATGVYDNKLKSSGRTFEEHYADYGFYRFTGVAKNGTTYKKGYTPGTFKAAVSPMLLEGETGIKVFAKCPVLWQCEEDGMQKFFRVYDEANAKKMEAGDDTATPLFVTKRKIVAEDGWSWRLIEKILKQSQGKETARLLKKEEDETDAYNAVEKVFIIERTYLGKNDEGQALYKNVAKEVLKGDCVY